MSNNTKEMLNALSNEKRNKVLSLLGDFEFKKVNYESDVETKNAYVNLIKKYSEQISAYTEAISSYTEEIKTINKTIDAAKKAKQSTTELEKQLTESKRMLVDAISKQEESRRIKSEKEAVLKIFNSKIEMFLNLKSGIDLELKAIGVNINLDTFKASDLPSITPQSLIDNITKPIKTRDESPPGWTSGKKRTESKESAIEKNGFLTDPIAILEKHLKSVGLENGMGTSNSFIFMDKTGNNYTIEPNKVTGIGSDDATLNKIIDIYIAGAKSKAEAAGKLNEFDITKLSVTTEGDASKRLMELCRDRGIGTALEKNLTRGQDVNNLRQNDLPNVSTHRTVRT